MTLLVKTLKEFFYAVFNSKIIGLVPELVTLGEVVGDGVLLV